MRKLKTAAFASGLLFCVASAAHASMGEAIGNYIIKKYNPQSVLIIHQKDSVGGMLGRGAAQFLADNGRNIAVDGLNLPVDVEEMKRMLDYMTKGGERYDLFYCVMERGYCDVAKDYLGAKSVGGPTLEMSLDEM